MSRNYWGLFFTEILFSSEFLFFSGNWEDTDSDIEPDQAGQNHKPEQRKLENVSSSNISNHIEDQKTLSEEQKQRKETIKTKMIKMMSS